MSPRSRGRPPGRGRRQPSKRRLAAQQGGSHRLLPPPGGESASWGEEATDCWFDEPDPADRRSWAIPSGHGTYQGLDLELLDPDDENDLMFLIEAQHAEFDDALRGQDDVIVDGKPFSPRLHVAMHQAVASQLLSDHPPETWQTVQRLIGLGYDWHNIMHMIAALLTEDVYEVMKEHRQFDPADYARRLNELPGDWPPPRAPGRR